jgi:hypothetical protein
MFMAEVSNTPTTQSEATAEMPIYTGGNQSMA